MKLENFKVRKINIIIKETLKPTKILQDFTLGVTKLSNNKIQLTNKAGQTLKVRNTITTLTNKATLKRVKEKENFTMIFSSNNSQRISKIRGSSLMNSTGANKDNNLMNSTGDSKKQKKSILKKWNSATTIGKNLMINSSRTLISGWNTKHMTPQALLILQGGFLNFVFIMLWQF